MSAVDQAFAMIGMAYGEVVKLQDETVKAYKALLVVHHNLTERCDSLTRQRDVLLKACERVYDDTDWCPVCEQHEHSASCILALVRDEDKGRQSAKLV